MLVPKKQFYNFYAVSSYFLVFHLPLFKKAKEKIKIVAQYTISLLHAIANEM